MKVLLLNMPFVSLSRPSIGLSLLKARPDEATYLATVRHHAGGDEHFATYERVRQEIDGFLDACLERYRVAEYDLVGFTSTFQQNVGSLALAKRIKQKWPHILTAMGGANCEGTMGLELSRSFEWMDFIFSGEADHSFPELVRRLDAGTA